VLAPALSYGTKNCCTHQQNSVEIWSFKKSYFYVNKPQTRREDKTMTSINGPPKRGEVMEEELMPELVALVLNHVDHVTLVACPFMCTMWKHASLPLLEHVKQEKEDYSQEVAANGWLVLQWAHTNSCPWDKAMCEQAAKGGHLDVLQWACATSRCSSGQRPMAAHHHDCELITCRHHKN
jgi:hypothetical protein